MLEHEVIHHIMRRGVRRGGCKAEDLDGAVVARGCEVFVRGVEGDALDVTLVHGKGLQLLERMTGPHHDFGVEADGHQDRGVVGPC